jgi:hypothetical protein
VNISSLDAPAVIANILFPGVAIGNMNRTIKRDAGSVRVVARATTRSCPTKLYDGAESGVVRSTGYEVWFWVCVVWVVAMSLL